MPARISREHLSDDSLSRAVAMMGAQLSQLGSLIHRYREDPDVEYTMRRDDDALCDVLGILLYERRMRGIEDEVERTTSEAAAHD